MAARRTKPTQSIGKARTRAAALAAAAAIGSLAWAPLAQAHDSVVAANPGVDETVAEFPDKLELEFSGAPKEDFNTLALSRVEDGEVLFSGEPTIEGRDVSIDVPADVDKQPGEYRIGFQITSSDGHATKGMTSFTFDPDGSLQALPAQEDNKSNIGGEESSQNSDRVTDSSFNWLWLLLGVILLGGVALAAMGRTNQHEKADKRIRDLDYNDQEPGNQYNRSGHTGAGETAGEREQGVGDAEPPATDSEDSSRPE